MSGVEWDSSVQQLHDGNVPGVVTNEAQESGYILPDQ